MYNNVTGYTTFSFAGESPSCMCESGKKTEPECAAHASEMAAYDATTYEKFKGKVKSPEPSKRSSKNNMIGHFSLSRE